MGEGAPRYRRELQAAVRRLAGNVAYHPTTQEPLARQIYAGADLFLAPSVFEPCGLTPLIALRYGTVPVVRRTGGLADTVKDYTEDPAAGLGFVFVQRRVASMLSAVDSALAVYRRVPEWRRLQQRAMEADFSWRAPAREYIALYDEAVRSRCGADVVRGAVQAAPRPGATPAGAPTCRSRPRPAPLPLALVHHANQFLVTDGYQDREGLTSIVTGYAALLKLHEKYRTPVALHLSGTMVEAVAWHHPWFLADVRRLARRRPALPHRRNVLRERPHRLRPGVQPAAAARAVLALPAPPGVRAGGPGDLLDPRTGVGHRAPGRDPDRPGRCPTAATGTSCSTTGCSIPPTAPTGAATGRTSTAPTRPVRHRPTPCARTASRAATACRWCRCRPGCATGFRRTTGGTGAACPAPPNSRPPPAMTPSWCTPTTWKKAPGWARGTPAPSDGTRSFYAGWPPSRTCCRWICPRGSASAGGSPASASSSAAPSWNWPRTGTRGRTTAAGSRTRPGDRTRSTSPGPAARWPVRKARVPNRG